MRAVLTLAVAVALVGCDGGDTAANVGDLAVVLLAPADRDTVALGAPATFRWRTEPLADGSVSFELEVEEVVSGRTAVTAFARGLAPAAAYTLTVPLADDAHAGGLRAYRWRVRPYASVRHPWYGAWSGPALLMVAE